MYHIRNFERSCHRIGTVISTNRAPGSEKNSLAGRTSNSPYAKALEVPVSGIRSAHSRNSSTLRKVSI